jgi:formylmethanofuran dehydrogenase subunit E
MSFPDFFDDAPVLRLHDPLAQLLGSATDGIMEYRYADAVRLAGHSCPTVAGAFLTARAALKVLYPDTLPERGGIRVHMPSAETEGTTGVVAQVLTLITGAAAQGGFKGIGGRFARNELLSFATHGTGHEGAVRFERLDTGVVAMVNFDAHKVPADQSQRERMQAVIQNRETPEQQLEFARLWQERVRRILLEHADDPALLHVALMEQQS